MEPMELLAWIVVGIIAGWLASQFLPSRLGLVGDMIIGTIGALIGGSLFNAVGVSGTTDIYMRSIYVAFNGAVVLLFLIRAVTARIGVAN